MAELNWEWWYEWGHDHCGIKVGDSVKVLRKATTKERGWSQTWDPLMDEFVGQTLTVSRVDKSFCCSPGHWWFPFFILELVQKKEPESPLPQSILDIIDDAEWGCPKASIKKLVAEILKQK